MNDGCTFNGRAIRVKGIKFAVCISISLAWRSWASPSGGEGYSWIAIGAPAYLFDANSHSVFIKHKLL
jgi:hypothetical protein